MPSFIYSWFWNAAIIVSVFLLWRWMKKFFFKPLRLGYARTSVRVYAWVIDMFILHVIVAVGFLVYGWTTGSLMPSLNAYAVILDDEGSSRFWYDIKFIEFYLLILYSLYASVLEATSLKSTFGKYFLDIEVVDEQGQRLSILKSVPRNALKFIVILIWPIFYPFCKMSEKRKWMHDVLIHTYVREKALKIKDVPQS